ncbi:MAG TPA: DUF3108 domain-containing protein [Azospirillaceae bacterium]|nr:DUF3108 domain-containing protein [Azospirillaceae bacterium]
MPLSSARRFYPLVFALVLTVGAAGPVHGSASPDGPISPKALKLGYGVYLGGVHILDATLRLDVTRDTYWVEVATKAEGFVARMMPWETRAESGGDVNATALHPQRHETMSRWRKKVRTVTLSYDGKGAVTTATKPPPAADDRDAVPERQRRNTVDPLSGVLGVTHAVAAGQGCNRAVPVFDGRRRYDLLFTETGRRDLAKTDYSVYAGPALLCRVAFKPIAGYPKKRENSRFWQSGPGGRPPADLWLAPVTAGGPPVPVRLETASVFGSILVHLRSIQPDTATAAAK